MGKVLFVILIGVVVWLLFFAKRTLKIRRDGDGSGTPPRSIASERMVECMRCGVHIPASEAAELVGQRGKYTCVEPERCGNLPG